MALKVKGNYKRVPDPASVVDSYTVCLSITVRVWCPLTNYLLQLKKKEKKKKEKKKKKKDLNPKLILHLNRRRKEGSVLFNDALNTFYLRLYGVRHMVKDHSDSERGNSLPPHGLLFPIQKKKTKRGKKKRRQKATTNNMIVKTRFKMHTVYFVNLLNNID